LTERAELDQTNYGSNFWRKKRVLLGKGEEKLLRGEIFRGMKGSGDRSGEEDEGCVLRSLRASGPCPKGYVKDGRQNQKEERSLTIKNRDSIRMGKIDPGERKSSSDPRKNGVKSNKKSPLERGSCQNFERGKKGEKRVVSCQLLEYFPCRRPEEVYRRGVLKREGGG